MKWKRKFVIVAHCCICIGQGWFVNIYYISACKAYVHLRVSTPQREQTKKPVCVSGWGIWMASGDPGRLVVTQVTPWVPGEKHIAADCSEEKKTEWTHWHASVFMKWFFSLHHSALAKDKVALCSCSLVGDNWPVSEVSILCIMQLCWEL